MEGRRYGSTYISGKCKSSIHEHNWKSKTFLYDNELSMSSRSCVVDHPEVSPSVTFKKYSDEEFELLEKPHKERGDIEANLQFYELGHAVRELLRCDVTNTILQLALLLDKPLDDPHGQNAFHFHGGYDLVINLLEVSETRCNIGALQIIHKLASTRKSVLLLTNLGVITPMVNLLFTGDIETLTHVAKTLTELLQLHKPARYFRKEGGIQPLMDCLDINESILYTPRHLLKQEEKDIVDLGTVAAQALQKVAKYSKNLKTIHKSGLPNVVKKVVNSCHRNLLVHTFLLLETCAKRDAVRLSIELDGILLPLLKGLSHHDDDLRAACASTIAQCAAKSELSRHLVRLLHGLDPIVKYVGNFDQPPNTLLALVSAASKLAQEPRNLNLMSKFGLVKNLTAIIQNMGVLETSESGIVALALEGMAECARMEHNRNVIDSSGIIDLVVGKLYTNDPDLVLATAQCLGTCARSPKLAQDILHLDGMRLLLNFVRLYSGTASICATVLWALRPIVHNNPDSAEEFRNIMGGFGLLVDTLKNNHDPSVLGQACGLVAEVALNYENRQVLTDRGVVRAIAGCTGAAKTEEIVQTVCEAITVLCEVPDNQHEFGMLGIVSVCRDLLLTRSLRQHLCVMDALAALTKNPFNCIVLHEAGGLELVLADAASHDHELQESAMMVVNNIRRVALNAEKRAMEKGSFEQLTRNYGSISLRPDAIALYEKQCRALHLALKKAMSLSAF